MTTITPKIRFDNASYWFVGLIILVLLGFWPSYFAKFLEGTNNYVFYFHFHAAMMSLWLAVLVVQPLLIRQKKLAIHKAIGKLTYLLMPLLFVSIILLKHSRLESNVQLIDGEKFYGQSLLVPFKDLLILGVFYTVAIVYRHNVQIHARAMIATGIVFIEPALSRFLSNSLHDGTARLCLHYWVCVCPANWLDDF